MRPGRRPAIDSKLADLLLYLYDGELPLSVHRAYMPIYAELLFGNTRPASRRKIREALKRLRVALE